MKFKPGITLNFIPRYVQISRRAFRYFRNESECFSGKPLVSFRKRIIKSALPFEVDKNAYLKPGSSVAKSHKEDDLFDNMFEITLNQDYESAYQYRKFDIDQKVRYDRQ